MHVTTLKKMVIPARMTRQVVIPSLNPRYSTKFCELAGTTLDSNSFRIKHSRAYLTGDTYWNHEIQTGKLPLLEKNPANIINGKRISGAIITDVSE